MAHIVSADMIVVRNREGQQIYLRKGVQLPDYVDEDRVKELKQAGLIDKAKSETRSRSRGRATAPVAPPAAGAGALFDPAKATQDEVLAYLADADAAEVARVKAAEAEGKQRKEIAAFNVTDPDGDGK